MPGVLQHLKRAVDQRTTMRSLRARTVVASTIAASLGLAPAAWARSKGPWPKERWSMSCRLWTLHAKIDSAQVRIPPSLQELAPLLERGEYSGYSAFQPLDYQEVSVGHLRASSFVLPRAYEISLRLLTRPAHLVTANTRLQRGPESGILDLDLRLAPQEHRAFFDAPLNAGRMLFVIQCQANLPR